MTTEKKVHDLVTAAMQNNAGRNLFQDIINVRSDMMQGSTDTSLVDIFLQMTNITLFTEANLQLIEKRVELLETKNENMMKEIVKLQGEIDTLNHRKAPKKVST